MGIDHKKHFSQRQRLTSRGPGDFGLKTHNSSQLTDEEKAERLENECLQLTKKLASRFTINCTALSIVLPCEHELTPPRLALRFKGVSADKVRELTCVTDNIIHELGIMDFETAFNPSDGGGKKPEFSWVLHDEPAANSLSAYEHIKTILTQINDEFESRGRKCLYNPYSSSFLNVGR